MLRRRALLSALTFVALTMAVLATQGRVANAQQMIKNATCSAEDCSTLVWNEDPVDAQGNFLPAGTKCLITPFGTTLCISKGAGCNTSGVDNTGCPGLIQGSNPPVKCYQRTNKCP